MTVLNCTTGINELSAVQVLVYPNPAHDVIHVRTSEPTLSVEVYNSMGQRSEFLLKHTGGNSFDVDCSQWKSGIHLLRIEAGNSFILKRIIVQ